MLIENKQNLLTYYFGRRVTDTVIHVFSGCKQGIIL